MSSLSRITCHPVHDMTREAREALARELFAVHSQIFTGLSYEEFRSYVVERDAWRTWCYVKHNSAGQLVGYTSMHAFRLLPGGRASTVIRLEAGTLPAYRGRDVTMVYAVLRLLRLWARRPWRRFCIFAALTHPSSYTFLAHYAPVIWPHARRKDIPPHLMQHMEELAASFDLERVDPANPLVRHVNWVTLESEEDRTRWHNSKRQDTRFYLDNNPGYTQGHGMLTYIPFNGSILLRSLVRFLVGRAGKITRLLLGREGKGAPRRRHPIESAFQPLESRPRDAHR
jgi:GNAT superfamily N-acetyltransferase